MTLVAGAVVVAGALGLAAWSWWTRIGSGHRPSSPTAADPVFDRITFAAPCPPAPLLDGVEAAIRAGRGSRARGDRSGPLRITREDRSLSFMIGARGADDVLYLVITTATPSGCVGEAGPAKWTNEGGAAVCAARAVARINELVKSAITDVHGTVRAADHTSFALSENLDRTGSRQP